MHLKRLGGSILKDEVISANPNAPGDRHEQLHGQPSYTIHASQTDPTMAHNDTTSRSKLTSTSGKREDQRLLPQPQLLPGKATQPIGAEDAYQTHITSPLAYTTR